LKSPSVGTLNGIRTFLIFATYGIFALGPLQWYNISIPADFRTAYKIGVPLASLIIAMLMRRSDRFIQYWRVFFGFFVGATAFLLQWLVFHLLTFPRTVESIALEKALASLLTIIPIIALTRLSGDSLGSIYVKRGALRTGLLVGVACFAFFAASAVPSAISMFNAKNVGPDVLLGWAPWVLIFVLGSGLLEEFMYRALFLGKYEAFFGPKTANILQAVIFCIIHLSVAYTAEPYLFVILTFFLGLAWGYMTQRTDSLLGSVLFHAGTDIPIIISIFSTLL
jgi:membrane protease YdiL (CAAX protease family)